MALQDKPVNIRCIAVYDQIVSTIDHSDSIAIVVLLIMTYP